METVSEPLLLLLLSLLLPLLVIKGGREPVVAVAVPVGTGGITEEDMVTIVIVKCEL